MQGKEVLNANQRGIKQRDNQLQPSGNQYLIQIQPIKLNDAARNKKNALLNLSKNCMYKAAVNFLLKTGQDMSLIC